MTARPEITSKNRVAPRPTAVSSLVDGEAVILDIEGGTFFQLNGVGSRIWTEIAGGIDVGSLCARLQGQFEGDPAACERDVVEFLNDLNGRGLLAVS